MSRILSQSLDGNYDFDFTCEHRPSSCDQEQRRFFLKKSLLIIMTERADDDDVSQSVKKRMHEKRNWMLASRDYMENMARKLECKTQSVIIVLISHRKPFCFIRCLCISLHPRSCYSCESCDTRLGIYTSHANSGKKNRTRMQNMMHSKSLHLTHLFQSICLRRLLV